MNIVEIITKVQVGSVWFLEGWQFEYTEVVTAEGYCAGCDPPDPAQSVKYYVVEYEDVEYELPRDNVAVMSVRVVSTERRTRHEQYVTKVTTDTSQRNGKTDYVQAAKDYLDIDTAAKNRVNQADLADQDELQRMVERHQQKAESYGRVRKSIGTNQPD